MKNNIDDRQLLLELAVRPALDREAFFVSPSNQQALQIVEGWQAWPDGRLCLTGDAGGGKTHLAHVWSAMAAPVIACSASEFTEAQAARIKPSEHVLIDAVETIKEETALLHLMNRLADGGGKLLFTARQSPVNWSVRLPDLCSRLASMAVVTLAPPDDSLLTALFHKQFQDRQIKVSDKIIHTLTSHIERSGLAVQNMVSLLDKMSLARKKPINKTLVKEALEQSVQEYSE